MKKIPTRRRKLKIDRLWLISLVVFLGACGSMPSGSIRDTPYGRVIKGEEFVIVRTNSNDTLQSLAREFLGAESRVWEISRLNNVDRIQAGQTIALPLQPLYPLGIYSNGYQTIPILAYHRFGLSETTMTVTPDSFSRQLAYLAKNDFTVISLKELIPFLAGEKQLPPKSIVLTFDDGYKSFYMFAYPLLLKYGFPGTVFVYSDFIDKKAGLSWYELKEMVDSGLIDIQPHSRFHTNLGLNKMDENEAEYEKRIEDEITHPSRRIKKHLGQLVHSFAYPYGDTNQSVIEKLQAADYQLAVTVQPGSNPAFASPYMLKRTMIFGDDDMAHFIRGLKSFEEVTLR